MKKVLSIVALFTFALGSHASCLDGYEGRVGDHHYTPLAICDEIVNPNVGNKATLSLEHAEVCVVKDVKDGFFSKKTSFLIQGPYIASVGNSSVYGGIFSSDGILKNVLEIIQASTKYLGSMEVSIYNLKTELLTIERGSSEKIEYKAILKCRKF